MSLTILQVSQNYRMYGGSDRYLLDLSSLLEANGHYVIPFAAQHVDNLKTKWERYFPVGANFERPGVMDLVKYVYSSGAKKSISRLIREQHIDVAHLHIYYGKLTASILKPLHDDNIPIVQTVHDYKLICPVYTLYANGTLCEKCKGKHYYNVLLNRCNRNSLSRSMLTMVESYVSRFIGAIDRVDHFIAVSQFVNDKLVQNGINSEKITTVHNYVDADKYTVTGSSGKYILYLGRLEKYKGIFTLLEAAKLVPEVAIKVAGSGNELGKVEKIITETGITNVTLLGYLGEVEIQVALDNAICTVVPSECYETFGLTITESFAKGKPVIISAMGGMPEIVSDGVDGSLFEVCDHARLAELMLWYWKHRDSARRMGERARGKVVKTFNPEIHLEKIMEIYESLLSR